MKGVSLTKLDVNKMFPSEFIKFLKSHCGNYLEIGVFDGVTLCEIAKQISDRKCYGIDPFISDGNVFPFKFGETLGNQEINTLENIREFPNITLFKETSTEFFKRLTNDMLLDLNISAVYIDGSHHLPDVTNDYHLAIKLIGSKRGLVIFDDLHIEDVRKGVEQAVTTYPHYFKSVQCIHHINL